jgi:pyruvate formate lyase activating enzyme
MISRRELLSRMGRGVVVLGGASLLFDGIGSDWLAAAESDPGLAGNLAEILKNAPVGQFWTSTALPGASCVDCHLPGSVPKQAAHDHGKGSIVRCQLCAQGCTIRDGERGKCRARMNVRGQLRSLVYGRPMTVHVDPIEKKPFYHFLPGSLAYSLSTSGCPLRCKFCQNWQISQASPEDYSSPIVSAAEVATAAKERKAPVVAFTYNEPTVFAEYLFDIAREARKRELRSVLVSCGFMQEKPLARMCELLDAIKIDLKGFSEEFYRNVSSAELAPVLRSIRQIHRSGVHLEIVNLVVPTLNDSEAMMKGLVEWVAGELGPDVPIHFTRFHPDYQLQNLPPTPVATLERIWRLAREKGLHYAYVGNVPDHPGNTTFCPKCAKAVVRRNGFFVTEQSLKKGRCAFCGEMIAGVWS